MPAVALSRVAARVVESGPDGGNLAGEAWRRLEALPDPRSPRGRIYPLACLIAVAVCAVAVDGKTSRGASAGRGVCPGSGVRSGICVWFVKLRVDPAFPVLFLRAHHGPHHGGLAGLVQLVRLAAKLAGGVASRRCVVTHGQPLLKQPSSSYSTVAEPNLVLFLTRVAVLHVDAGRHPCDPQLAELIADLSRRDDDFRRWWTSHDVLNNIHGTRLYHHPIAGNLILDYEIFSTAGDEDQRLVLHTAEPGSPSERALQQLARTAVVPVGNQ
jgi:MmyB-like transcription regulator ligand binding domain